MRTIHALALATGVFAAVSTLTSCGGVDAPVSSMPQFSRYPAEFRKATDHYGELYVKEIGEMEVAVPAKPWSSHWFPARETYLFEWQGQGKEAAPLQKYDTFAKRRKNIDAKSSQFERENFYDPYATGWEGLCNAWAVASLVAPEPRQPMTLNGIRFGVGDLKAIIVKTYEDVEGMNFFGQRYLGDRLSLHTDIHPDQFHRIVQAEMFERGRPIIIDHDPGIPVWNTPIWRAGFNIARDQTDPNVLHVAAWFSGARPFVPDYDYVGTVPISFEYTYDLYGYQEGDSFRVVRGEWTGRSLDDHPDFVTTLPEGLIVHRSRNTEIDNEVVSELLSEMLKVE